MIPDNEIVKGILTGNHESYAYLVNKYKHMVFSVCFRILENREEAEDISQEVFVKAFFSLNKHKSNESKFSNWLYRIAFTTSISKKRDFKLRKLKANELYYDRNEKFDLNNAFIEMEKIERKIMVRDAIDSLKNDEKLITHLYYFLDCSIEEISFITKQSKKYIKLRLYRIRLKIKDFLVTKNYKNDLI